MSTVLVAVASAKGAPGATTVALGLAARWPGADALLVEADPSGGDLATRYGVRHEPGLTTMAATTKRTAPVPELVGARWWRRLPCGVPAVLAPPGSAAAASLTRLHTDHGADLPRRFAAPDTATIVDVGRWHPSSPADPLVAAADVVLLTTTGAPEQLPHLHTRLDQLRATTADIRLVVVADPAAAAPDELAQTLQLPLAAVVPHDRRGVRLLTDRPAGRNRRERATWHRTPLARACRRLARRLYATDAVLASART